MDYSVKIGGEAGQGIQTIGDTLARVFARSGYHVFTHQDYESRIRGGHNFFQIRFSGSPVTAPRDRIDILVALDKESIEFHERELTDTGLIIYDAAMLRNEYAKAHFLDVPFVRLAVEQGHNRVMANTVATGAVLGMLGMELDLFIAIIKETFRKKGEEVISANVRAAMAGHDYALKHCTRCSFAVPEIGRPRMLLNGVEAIALGAVSAGCRLYSAYPMTPSTGIMNLLAGYGKEYGIIVEQAEDEIAAINMALGASYGGVRAMTGTSGGGFALMVEGLSLAAMTETPIVIALGQRPGPATGLPTRTEQADLLFALYTAHGEFPRVIFAPGTPEEAFFLTNRAFDLTEKYQVPALVIFDQYLADCQWTSEGFDLKGLRYHDYRLRGERLQALPDYRRHALTDSGISPLAVPGDSPHLVVTDSDEHDEKGHIIEDAETRQAMVRKRLHKKMALLGHEISPPTLYGDPKAEVVLTGWGSTYGVIKECVDALSKERSVAMLHFSEVYPFPSAERFDFLSVLKNAGLAISIENNATSQFARLVRAETGFTFGSQIHKYDGRPFTFETLLGEVHAQIRGL